MLFRSGTGQHGAKEHSSDSKTNCRFGEQGEPGTQERVDCTRREAGRPRRRYGPFWKANRGTRAKPGGIERRIRITPFEPSGGRCESNTTSKRGSSVGERGGGNPVQAIQRGEKG